MDRYNWKGINYSSEKDDCKIFEKNLQQALFMFCMLKKKKNIFCFCFSKRNSNRAKHVILLMVLNEEKQREGKPLG